MPTGYTAPVIDGEITTAEQFAAECASAFVWSARERPGYLAYPSAKTEDYYAKALAKDVTELAEWDNMSEEGRYAKWSAYATQSQKHAEEAQQKAHENFIRLNKVRREVEELRVPRQLAKFKSFMLDQLDETIKYDGKFMRDYYKTQNYSEWCDNQRPSILRSMKIHTESIAERAENVRKSREWISLLAQTFNLTVVDPDTEEE